MNLKATIKSLIGIDIKTDNFEALYNFPEDYVTSKDDLAVLKDLISLLDTVTQPEVAHYDYK